MRLRSYDARSILAAATAVLALMSCRDGAGNPKPGPSSAVPSAPTAAAVPSTASTAFPVGPPAPAPPAPPRLATTDLEAMARPGADGASYAFRVQEVTLLGAPAVVVLSWSKAGRPDMNARAVELALLDRGNGQIASVAHGEVTFDRDWEPKDLPEPCADAAPGDAATLELALDPTPYVMRNDHQALGVRVTCARATGTSELATETLFFLRPWRGAFVEVLAVTTAERDVPRAAGDRSEERAVVAMLRSTTATVFDIGVTRERRTGARADALGGPSPAPTRTVVRYAWDGTRYVRAPDT